MKKMPFRRKKAKLQKRHSFFTDQVIQDCSIASSPCELYFPEPSLVYDEFGAVKDVCLSGDLTLVWSKYCVVHLCKIYDVSSDVPFTLEGAGQENEVCFSVVLNRKKGEDFEYTIHDKHWHEYSQKVGERKRRFVLKFDDKDQIQYEDFVETITDILREVNVRWIKEANCKITYLLVAVQTPADKRKSNLSENRNSRQSLLDLRNTGLPKSDSDSTLSDPENSSLGREEKEEVSLGPPFKPAPFFPIGQEGVPKSEETKILNKSEKFVGRKLSVLCDSLHIHPTELPQTLESILKSLTLSETLATRGDLSKIDENKSDNSSSINYERDEIRSNYDESRLDSDRCVTEDLFVPMGIVSRSDDKLGVDKVNDTASMEPKMATGQNSRLKKAQELAHGLEAAINNNDAVKAQNFAKDLTLQNVKCKIEVKLKEQTQSDKDKDFNLKVNIEDKETSGSSIMLKVRSTDTIRDLKNRMLIKHMFPVEVQFWIIGKRIPADTETLEKCRIKTHGYTAFLYLVSAKSAGIDKEQVMNQRAMLMNPEYAAGVMPQMNSPEGAGGHVLGRQSSKGAAGGSPGSATPGAQSGPSPGVKPKKEHGIAVENFNRGKGAKQARDKLQGQGHGARGQVQGQKPDLINALQMSGQDRPQTIDDIVGNFGNANVIGQMNQRVPVMHPQEDEETPVGWTCPHCTYLNLPTRPGCEICTSDRPEDYVVPADYVITDEEKQRLDREALIERQTREAQERERLAHVQQLEQNYAYLQQTDAQGVVTNTEQFTCPICFEDIPSGEGVVLRECLHTFCRDCLSDAIQYNEEPVLKCPYRDDEYGCDGLLQEREVKGLVSQEAFAKYLARSLATAESQAQNSFHCKTPDCPGWCIYEDHVNFFLCQVCKKENCLTCKAIHQGMNCQQYQDDLKLRAVNDKAANQTQIMIRKMLDDGDAMNCPQCRVIVMKKEGCDWIQCSICKTEICWVTKGPRWGPLGNGDTSGGCRCRVNGEMCHPDCNNCH